jgi:hypothetical protein
MSGSEHRLENERSGRCVDMLTVVEDDEHGAAAQRAHDAQVHRRLKLWIDVQGVGHRSRDLCVVLDARQFRDAHTVAILVAHELGNLEREPRLADPGRPVIVVQPEVSSDRIAVSSRVRPTNPVSGRFLP